MLIDPIVNGRALIRMPYTDRYLNFIIKGRIKRHGKLTCVRVSERAQDNSVLKRTIVHVYKAVSMYRCKCVFVANVLRLTVSTGTYDSNLFSILYTRPHNTCTQPHVHTNAVASVASWFICVCVPTTVGHGI